jgi:hypothetical protein
MNCRLPRPRTARGQDSKLIQHPQSRQAAHQLIGAPTRTARTESRDNVSTMDNEDLLTVPTSDDRERINAVWRALCDVPEITNISPQNRMDIWLVEHRLRAERLATARLTRTARRVLR